MDDLEAQQAFAAKNNLGFPLAADVDRKLIDAYGVWGERTRPDGTKFEGIRRYTFLIDRDGTIRKVYTNVTPDTHAGEILQDLAALG
jgi:peroxiredoxin Q/BCP